MLISWDFTGIYGDSLRFSPRLSLHRGSFRGSWASWAASSVAPAASSSVASTWTNAKCGGPRMAGAPRDGTGLRWVFGGMDYGIVIHNLVSLPMEYWWNTNGILMLSIYINHLNSKWDFPWYTIQYWVPSMENQWKSSGILVAMEYKWLVGGLEHQFQFSIY